ncbi:MAG TPA: antitoxin Xre-like helix-turn-helix domain-containing protein [Candidatus Tumulicola sp.]
MMDLMGGPDLFKVRLEREIDVETAVAKGLPAKALRSLAERTGTSLRQLQEITQIDKSTFQRRERLKTDESDRIVRVARVVVLAIDALGRPEALAWLRRSNLALGNRVPLDLLGSDSGVRQVEQVIGRIEHGVFS